MVTQEYSEAAVEVLGILNTLEEKEFNKIPREIIEFLENNKSDTYDPDIDYFADVEDLNLKEKTKEIIAGIYLDYFCPESRKQAYSNIIEKNRNKYEEELKETYNSDNIFKKQNKEEVKTTEMLMVQEEGFLKKVMNKIKGIFKN
ncbi:MAG: hypothetical protein J6I85_07905 [Clostridia bacterium]|nr:hypothetical protein [Clostridia bacterium]